MFKDNYVHRVEHWRVSRPEGIAVLGQIWGSMLHFGHEPDASERSSMGDSTLGVRLCPSVFDVYTPIVDEDEDADEGVGDNKVVTPSPSSDTSGVFLRMAPNSRPAVGTKRRVCPAGGSYPPGSHRGSLTRVALLTSSIGHSSKDVLTRFAMVQR